jgi:RNA polymerase sigma-70 factor, ECF subfamily
MPLPPVLALRRMSDPAPEVPQGADRDPAAWADLMRRAQDGDGAAYRRLLAAVAPLLRSMAARWSSHPHDIEDAVQDILLTVHTIRHTYDPARPFKPWLAAVAHHRLVDRLRGRKRRLARETPLGPEHETFPAPETNVTMGTADGATLRAALASLPPGQRQAIELMKLREMSLKEAATTTGLSVASLKVATHRGLAKLRHLLGEKAST